MKSINNFIIEKLNKINKSTIVKADDYWHDEMEDIEHMPKEFYNIRKSNRDNGTKNKAWYAVVVYLSVHEKASKNEIKEALWPGKTGQQAELFTALNYNNITITEKKLKKLNPFKDWKYNYL